jgi:hypothetical protein
MLRIWFFVTLHTFSTHFTLPLYFFTCPNVVIILKRIWPVYWLFVVAILHPRSILSQPAPSSPLTTSCSI